MSKLLRVLLALLFPVLIALLLAGAYLKHYLDSDLQLSSSSETFVLSRGTGFSSAVNQAAERGWLTKPQLLKVYGRLFPEKANIRAGEYRVSGGTTVGQWLTMLRDGEVLRHQLTFVEGWTLSQLLSSLDNHPLLAEQALENSAKLWSQLAIEEPLANNPEGLFFPDTYDFQRDDLPAELLRRAYRRLVKVLSEEWVARDVGLPYETPYDALIMASIIEKETGVPSERSEIAGVFVRRLQRGMRLQTDPTVIYGMGEQYRGNIRGRDLRDDSNPYNTYRINGLPPTPIALAGREAIHAALHPAPGNSLFFVAKGDGSHQFSATLAEHEAAVRRYQLQRRSDYRSSPAKSEARR